MRPVRQLTASPDWPTAATKPLWLDWVFGFVPPDSRTWSDQRFFAPIEWSVHPPPAPGAPVRAHHIANEPFILSSTGERLGKLHAPLNPARRGLVRMTVADEPARVNVAYLGPPDLWIT